MLHVSSNHQRFRSVYKLLAPILQHHPIVSGPGQLAVMHQHTFGKTAHISTNGSSTGMVFELIIYDVLIHFGVHPTDMYLSVKHPTTNTEIDILVRRRSGKAPIGIMAKTSLRERWKQEDRDAMAIRNDESGAATYILNQCGMKYDRAAPPIIWCLTHREKANTTPNDAVAHANRIGGLCHAITGHRFISIYDYAGMDALLKECLA